MGKKWIRSNTMTGRATFLYRKHELIDEFEESWKEYQKERSQDYTGASSSVQDNKRGHNGGGIDSKDGHKDGQKENVPGDPATEKKKKEQKLAREAESEATKTANKCSGRVVNI